MPYPLLITKDAFYHTCHSFLSPFLDIVVATVHGSKRLILPFPNYLLEICGDQNNHGDNILTDSIRSF